ncbi:MAG: hypothetical protein COA42_15800 [Alteromonadaceae bacterium]|nr:MAG: hypothetical protein COA42_15800 [Alteromonadaceae bacterium]
MKAPNRHLMAFVTFLSLVPMVYFVPDFVAQYTGGIKWLNVVVSVGIIVPIISYIIMPLTIKFFK